MGVTVAVALPLNAIRDYMEFDAYKAKLVQVELENVAVEAEGMESCVYANNYILPENFPDSQLMEEIKSNLSENRVYQLIMFLIEANPETSEDLEEISGDVLLGLEEGDFTSITQNVLAIYVYEYDNI